MAVDKNLTDPELRVMNVVWDSGEIEAKGVVAALLHECTYNASTTYTLIYRCMKKGLLARRDPGFILWALISREDIQDSGAAQLADRLFDGSVDKLFAALVDHKMVSSAALERMRAMIQNYESSDKAIE